MTGLPRWLPWALTPIRVAIWRYLHLARALDYLPRDVVWWVGAAAYCGLEGVAYGPLSGLAGAVSLLAWRVLQRRGRRPSMILLAVVWVDEVVLWLNVGSSAASLARGEDPRYWLANVAVDVIVTYLFIDLMFPPRPRRRVKVKVRRPSMPRVRLAPAPSPS